MSRYFLLVILLIFSKTIFSQAFDVRFYDLTLDIDIENKFTCNNKIHFHSKNLNDSIKIDLSNKFVVDSVLFLNQKCEYVHKNDVIMVSAKNLKKDNYF